MPSHYLNQCWLIVNWPLRNKLRRNLFQNTEIVIEENACLAPSNYLNQCLFIDAVYGISLVFEYAHTESWWRHQMETFSALLAICAGNSPIPAQRPVTRSFDVFFDLRLNKRLSKQWWGWWSETLSRPLWRNVHTCAMHIVSIAIGRHGIWSSLVPAMACRLFGTKPLSETMLIHCQLYTIKH